MAPKKNSDDLIRFIVYGLLAVIVFKHLLSIPHADVLGSFGYFYNVQSQGGLLHWDSYWEHRPLLYSALVYFILLPLLLFDFQSLKLETIALYFQTINVLIVALTAFLLSKHLSFRFKGQIITSSLFAINCVALLSVSRWIFAQPEYYAVLFVCMSIFFLDAESKLKNLVGATLLLAAVLMKFVTIAYTIVPWIYIWLFFKERRERLAYTFLTFMILLFSISVIYLIHPTLRSDTLLGTAIQGNTTISLIERSLLFFQGLLRSFFHIPLGIILVPVSVLLLPRQGKTNTLIFFTILVIVLLPAFIQRSSFGYHFSGLLLAAIFILNIATIHRVSNLKETFLRIELAALCFTLWLIVVLYLFNSNVSQVPESKRWGAVYWFIVFLGLGLVFVIQPLKLKNLETCLGLFAAVGAIFITDERFHKSIQERTLSSYVEMESVIRDFKKTHSLNGEETLFLTSSQWPIVFRERSACKHIYPTIIQRTRNNKIFNSISEKRSYKEALRCIKNFNGNIILYEPNWFRLPKVPGLRKFSKKMKSAYFCHNLGLRVEVCIKSGEKN